MDMDTGMYTDIDTDVNVNRNRDTDGLRTPGMIWTSEFSATLKSASRAYRPATLAHYRKHAIRCGLKPYCGSLLDTDTVGWSYETEMDFFLKQHPEALLHGARLHHTVLQYD